MLDLGPTAQKLFRHSFATTMEANQWHQSGLATEGGGYKSAVTALPASSRASRPRLKLSAGPARSNPRWTGAHSSHAQRLSERPSQRSSTDIDGKSPPPKLPPTARRF